jgi:hypothetical protein
MVGRAIAGAAVAMLVALVASGLVTPALALPRSAPILSQLETANVTDVGFTVSWVTNELSGGYVRYGTSDTQLNLQANDSRGAGYVGYTHYVNVSSLVANSTYWFSVTSGDTTGTAQSLRTGTYLGQPPAAGIFDGTIRQSDGQTPAAGALVTVYVQRGSIRSAKQIGLAGDDGRFQIDLALALAEDYNSFFSPVGGDTVRYQVNGGPQNLMPYDGPSGAQRFEMQAVLDGESLPDVVLPNQALPTVTPVRSPTPARTRTPTTVRTTVTAGASTPTAAPATGTATPGRTPSATPVPFPSPTGRPAATAEAEPTARTAPPTVAIPSAPAPPPPSPAASPAAIPSATGQPSSPTALLRPLAPIDPAARATRTALAALFREPGVQQPTPPPLPTAETSDSAPAGADGDASGWMPPSVRALVIVATLVLAAGLGLVTAQAVREWRKGSGRGNGYW